VSIINLIEQLYKVCFYFIWKRRWGPSRSYGGWIYNYLYNQSLSPLKLWVRIPFRQGVVDTTSCDKVCGFLH